MRRGIIRGEVYGVVERLLSFENVVVEIVIGGVVWIVYFVFSNMLSYVC